MKNCLGSNFKEMISVDELNKLVNKNAKRKNKVSLWLVFMLIIAAAGAVAYFVIKHKNEDDFDDDFDDDDFDDFDDFDDEIEIDDEDKVEECDEEPSGSEETN